MSDEKTFDHTDGARKLGRFLAAHGATPACQVCSNKHWSILHHHSGYTAIFGDNMLGMFLVYTRKCTNCGYMQSFSRSDVDNWCKENGAD
ncbi:hypothetical protein [Acetobacter pasteurianus]|uniref:hypothetical protein n=1 Tax=Acetobacter pasteurianus TaxID=438 RepID=UPI000F54CA4C|nr:hypothetical protein [Acetobacter pasteurianus]